MIANLEATRKVVRLDHADTNDAGNPDAPAPRVFGQGWHSLSTPTWDDRCKTILEFGIAVVLLFLSLPIICLAAIAIKLTSSGPVFYAQKRLGRRARPFTLWKLRTMYHDCEAATGPCWSGAGDPRITSVGWFLRTFHLDELPQLWNVLVGEMSLVGPRPERPELIRELEPAVPYYALRLLVKPGITGLAQVRYPPDTDLASVRRKLFSDLYYVWNRNLGLDLRLLLATPLYLTRLPFAWIRQIINLPSDHKIRRVYEALLAADQTRSFRSSNWQRVPIVVAREGVVGQTAPLPDAHILSLASNT